ncbi:hypothetical protein [Bowmanella denitrificans]|uniref:hypothetical protein n=1 Tax=Bowmanella denitrificans TaxID=366582 RepID=UPI0011AEE71D|nr:hypothetical protein [Bowmanella denitrificans]
MFNLSSKCLGLILATILLSGCETLPFLPQNEPLPVNQPVSAEGYYKKITKLDSTGIKTEVSHQQQLAETGDEQAAIHLVMLYSLPGSPLKNSQLARSHLRQYLQKQSDDDLGLLHLLSDQLDEQIQLQRESTELDEKIRRLQSDLKKEQRDREWLQKQKQSLEQQLQQLKAIERNILKREAETNGK